MLTMTSVDTLVLQQKHHFVSQVRQNVIATLPFAICFCTVSTTSYAICWATLSRFKRYDIADNLVDICSCIDLKCRIFR